MLKVPNTDTPFDFQPPKKIAGVRVDYLESSITTFQNKYWVTMIPMDETDGRIWEFCLYDGKTIKTK